MDERVLDAIAVDLTYVEIGLNFGDFGCFYPVSRSPYTLFGSCMLYGYQTSNALNDGCSILTWSSNVSQNERSISVTTRPGASGVPLWSSLTFT